MSRRCRLVITSLGKAAVADEGCCYADEGEEVLGLAFVAAVQAAAAGDGPERQATPRSLNRSS